MPASAFRDPVGWPFLPRPEDGRLVFPTLERSVRDAIRIILTTRAGEQLMRPRFGAGLQTFLDESSTIALRRRIQSAVLDGLQQYEPRIAVDRIDVDPVDGAPADVHVRIFYRLMRTNAPQTLAVTLRSA